MLNNFKPAKLVLASGEILNGYAPKWQTITQFGEVVFNTGMTGYEETLTDPSYSGQILTFTYPILGNYGVGDKKYWESGKVHVKGMICQTLYENPYHYNSQQTLLKWLEQENISLLVGLDTRYLTKIIRQHGVIEGALVFDDKIPNKFSDSMTVNWVEKVSINKPQTFGNGKYKVVLVDCGAKQNILRKLLSFNTQVTVVPFDYDYTQIECDGIFLSNGPGDPQMYTATINILKQALQGKKPIYGICLGSQLMALATGANTYKLKFGHRGQNQPCIDIATNKCYLTSQNHGYAVDEHTLSKEWQVTFRHLNDNTVAGIKHITKPFNAVQFHPEAAPGPEDTFYFFKQFIQALKSEN
jgi:carbamoyl-phosphate synthase small subunit